MESTLSHRKSDYESKVGAFAGFGLGASAGDKAWDTRKAYVIRDSVEEGLRRFYFCGHKWSFLRPFLTLTFAEGETTVAMPDDCGGFEGPIAVSDSSSGIFRPLDLLNPGRIEQMYSENPEASGRPMFASMRALKGVSSSRGQRFELYLYPVADAEYTLRGQSYILPNYLDGTHEFAYGGAEHSSTIMESCLAVYEERYDDQVNGPHAQAYERRLRDSVMLDSRKKAQVLGRNTDRSDEGCFEMIQNLAPVTYNGVDFS